MATMEKIAGLPAAEFLAGFKAECRKHGVSPSQLLKQAQSLSAPTQAEKDQFRRSRNLPAPPKPSSQVPTRLLGEAAGLSMGGIPGAVAGLFAPEATNYLKRAPAAIYQDAGDRESINPFAQAAQLYGRGYDPLTTLQVGAENWGKGITSTWDNFWKAREHTLANARAGRDPDYIGEDKPTSIEYSTFKQKTDANKMNRLFDRLNMGDPEAEKEIQELQDKIYGKDADEYGRSIGGYNRSYPWWFQNPRGTTSPWAYGGYGLDDPNSPDDEYSLLRRPRMLPSGGLSAGTHA